MSKGWIEGLDWIRVEDLLQDWMNPESREHNPHAEEVYTKYLASFMKYLEGDLDKADAFFAESYRRVEAGEMFEEARPLLHGCAEGP